MCSDTTLTHIGVCKRRTAVKPRTADTVMFLIYLQQKESDLRETNTQLHEAEKHKEKITKEMGTVRQDIDTQKVPTPLLVYRLDLFVVCGPFVLWLQPQRCRGFSFRSPRSTLSYCSTCRIMYVPQRSQ